MSNPDRTLILDLSAIADARGPEPNDFFVCLTPREAGAAAIAVAAMLHQDPCPVVDCPDCNRYRRLFWDMVNELGPGLQGEVFSHLDVSHVAIPDGPWEEVR
jgi:hypothetical protein